MEYVLDIWARLYRAKALAAGGLALAATAGPARAQPEAESGPDKSPCQLFAPTPAHHDAALEMSGAMLTGVGPVDEVCVCSPGGEVPPATRSFCMNLFSCHSVRGSIGIAVLASCTALAALVGSPGVALGQSTKQDAKPAASSTPLNIVATIAMAGDLAVNVGGDRVKVKNIMGEGIDPHLYKASPGDVRLMTDADMILYSGLHLEGRMADLIVKMASRRTVVQVTDTIDEKLLREPPEFAGHFDPHVWFDVSLWSTAATRVRDALIAKDPDGKDAYTKNAEAYTKLLAELHQYAKDTLATIPKESRVMVTAHDAFGYFGRAYGLEVLAIQGISTDSEASLQDINALVDTLVSRKVPAVFIESSVPRKTIDALVEGCKSKGHTVAIGGELFSDAMGKEGTMAGCYVGMVAHNVDTVAKALGGKVPEKKMGALGEWAAKFKK